MQEKLKQYVFPELQLKSKRNIISSTNKCISKTSEDKNKTEIVTVHIPPESNILTTNDESINLFYLDRNLDKIDFAK